MRDILEFPLHLSFTCFARIGAIVGHIGWLPRMCRDPGKVRPSGQPSFALGWHCYSQLHSSELNWTSLNPTVLNWTQLHLTELNRTWLQHSAQSVHCMWDFFSLLSNTLLMVLQYWILQTMYELCCALGLISNYIALLFSNGQKSTLAPHLTLSWELEARAEEDTREMWHQPPGLWGQHVPPGAI